ncbi:TetR/AcrR family transcriptional regulator [Herbiconiux liukaitaii]|uniref:TetR/AcrR family transcriptional regulator n=1 Tax=Herbiconiux liukaitaii TaxID=3342799 RepID=UPI0035B97644
MAQPRGRERELAILQIVRELLHEVGYERLTVDAVVVRARASKSTIYGRWRDKATLVGAALTARSLDQPHLQASSGRLRDDLAVLLRLWVELAETESMTTFVSVLIAAGDEPTLAEIVRGTALAPRRAECALVVQWAAERGDIADGSGAEELFDLLMGKVLVRYVLDVQPLTEAQQAAFVDEVLMPVLSPGR